MEGGGGSHPKLKLEGEPRLLGKAMSISLYDFRMGCDPTSLFIMQIKGRGVTPHFAITVSDSDVWSK